MLFYMREGPQLGVAKAARAPPCTHPILGRRFIFVAVCQFFYYEQISRFIEKEFLYLGPWKEKTIITCSIQATFRKALWQKSTESKTTPVHVLI